MHTISQTLLRNKKTNLANRILNPSSIKNRIVTYTSIQNFVLVNSTCIVVFIKKTVKSTAKVFLKISSNDK